MASTKTIEEEMVRGGNNRARTFGSTNNFASNL
jgi:hypothetical protein